MGGLFGAGRSSSQGLLIIHSLVIPPNLNRFRIPLPKLLPFFLQPIPFAFPVPFNVVPSALGARIGGGLGSADFAGHRYFVSFAGFFFADSAAAFGFANFSPMTFPIESHSK